MIKPLETVEKTGNHSVSGTESDRIQFGQIVGKYQHLVTSVAYSLTGDFQRSEDIAQKTFLLAWEKGYRSDEGYLKSWLRTTAQNLAKNENRLMHNRSVSLNEHSEFASPKTDGPDLETKRELLWQSISHIPEKYRQVMILFYQQEKSIAQVADLLDLTEDAVKQRLSRGRKMLKQEVEKWVDETLQTYEPSPTFVAGVLAILPTGTVLAKTAVKSGVSYGLSSVFGKFLGLLSTGGLAGLLGGFAGAGIGLWGAKIGTDNSIKHATSEEEKQLIRGLYNRMKILTLFLVVGELVTVFALRGLFIQPFVLFALPAIFSGFLIWYVISFGMKQKELHKKHGKPAWTKNYHSNIQQVSPLGLSASIFGFTVGIWTWFIVLSGISQQWIWLYGSAVTLTGLLLLGCSIAFNCSKQWQQRKFYGAWCLLNAWIQFPMVIAFWYSFPAADKVVEETPMTGVQGLGLPVPTLLIGGLMFLVLNIVGILILRYQPKNTSTKQ